MCGGNTSSWGNPATLKGLSPRVRGKPSRRPAGFSRGRSIPACAGETRCGCWTTTRSRVYPRVCGGNAAPSHSVHGHQGLSPRVRGKRCNPTAARRPRRSAGSIPACAGETRRAGLWRGGCRVYPRVCGGNTDGMLFVCEPAGLSPRVRGKRRPHRTPVSGRGSIPACAGETPTTRQASGVCRVYPRVCGGNVGVQSVRLPLPGLSPRVRGKLVGLASFEMLSWSIPACAGETGRRCAARRNDGVYPRVCGGNGRRVRTGPRRIGLSPRVRGKLCRPRFPGSTSRSIPACAGETATSGPQSRVVQVYPRVCGGNGPRRTRGRRGKGLSPRVRGKQKSCGVEKACRRSIPACAGETACGGAFDLVSWVYPRVCGGNLAEADVSRFVQGLSPRVRGKPCRFRTTCSRAGSIPACAGETTTSEAWCRRQRVYPRVCGGNRERRVGIQPPEGLSPRVRGKPH